MANARARLPDELLAVLGRAIAFRPLLSQLCGNLAAGIMVSQAIYWCGVTDDPQGWFYKSAAEWQRETSVTLAQQEHARAILRTTSFWYEARRSLPAKLYYRVDLEQLRHALAKFEVNQQSRFGKRGNLDSAKYGNKNHAKAQSSLQECGDPYKEAEITSQSTDRHLIPPAPLSKGGDAATLSVEVVMKRGQDFKGRLKRELQDTPLNSRHLSTDDYDRYFRDVCFIGMDTGRVRVETDNEEMTGEGLRKYDTRLKKLGKRVFGRDVEFEIAHEAESESPQGIPPNSRRET